MAAENQNITVNERVPSSKFNRYVEENVREWMDSHQIQAEGTDYEVAFFDENPLGEVSCLIVLHQGEHLWRAWESADSPNAALARSLERLHEDLGKKLMDPSQQDDVNLTH